MSFSEFGLSPEILDGIRDMGYSRPTPIQQQAIPLVLEGRDIVASAQTGTGKTAAFVVPILEKLRRSPNTGLQCLILSPTRELAQQIDEQIFAIGYYADIPSVTIYGGGDWGEQQRALERGVRIIVATPGRLLDLIKVRNIDFSKIEVLVLDEADRMLDMGFIPDVRTIINRVPKQRQTLFFSATIHDKLAPLLDEFLINPARVAIAPNRAAKGVNQWMYFVDYDLKADLIRFLMQDDRFPSAIVFAGTKRGADELARELRRRKLAVASIHGDRTQQEREDALAAFKRGDIRVLVATDVLARGIDIEEVSLVINYDVPREVEDYIHRIGRTARADAKGDAITFVGPQDRRYLDPIRKAMGDKLIVLDVPQELLGNRPPMDPNEGGDGRRDRRPEGDRGRRPRHGDAPRQERRQPEPVPAVEPEPATEAAPAAEETAQTAADTAPKRHRSGRRGRKPHAEGQELEPDAAPSGESPKPPRPPKNEASETPASRDEHPAAETDASDSEGDDVERKRRRRSRGGRNRRRKRSGAEGESPASGEQQDRPAAVAALQEPKKAPANRPQGAKDTRDERTNPRQGQPGPDQRRQNDRNSGRNESRGHDSGQRGGQGREERRGHAESRGGNTRQGGGRGGRRHDRSPNYGVTHKLPVTNDLSSMSTSIKGGAPKKASAKPEPPKKGVFGFIKKLFGRDE